MTDPRQRLLDAFDGLDVKTRVQVILAAIETGMLTADDALPAFSGLWETRPFPCSECGHPFEHHPWCHPDGTSEP